MADVADEVIAEDYALSAVMLRPVRETMLTVLAHLMLRHGGAARYLAAIGVTSQQIACLGERMRR